MPSIRDIATITSGGKVKSAKALVDTAKPFCAYDACTEQVSKVGSFCSMRCYGRVHNTPDVEETPMTTTHTSPCGDKACIDAECQARVHIRQHLLSNMSEQDRIKHSDAIIAALHTLLADPEYATADPEALAAQAIETGVQNVREGVCLKAERKEQPLLTTTTKAVRIPRVAKHQPRTTDSKEHPVTEKITMTKAEMEAAIAKAVEARIAERERQIRATPVTKPEDKPVEVVSNRKEGGRAKIKRATAADREFAGVVLPAIVVNDALTIPALEVGEQSIDTLVPPKVRSPYNKARFRLDAKPLVLDGETVTYRLLMAEHERIAGLVKAKGGSKQATIGGAVADEKATKAEAKVAAVVATDDKAKRKAQVKALMTVMGISKAEAKALIG